MRIILLILISFNSSIAFCPDKIESVYTKNYNSEVIEIVRHINILHSIIHIETRFNHRLHNLKEDAVGILQIRPIMIREVNRICEYEKYTLEDRWDIQKSIEIFNVIQNYHNPKLDLKRACIVWNGKSKENKYYYKVLKQYNKIVKL